MFKTGCVSCCTDVFAEREDEDVLCSKCEEIEHLKGKIKFKEITEKAVNSHVREQSRKVKHLFPLENTAGYGQLCDKVLELENYINKLKGFINNIDAVTLHSNPLPLINKMLDSYYDRK